MENIFLEFFNLSIKACPVILAVLVLRIFLKKAPKWINLILWAVVGVRLIFPFSVESVFGLIPSADLISEETLYQSAPTIDSGIEIVNNAVNPAFSEIFAASPENSVNPLQIVTIIGSYVWVIGIAVMLCYAIFSYLLLKKKTCSATLYENNIFQSENIPSPFVFGIIKPKIYIPYNTEEKDISYIIAHERAHIKRRDHLIKPFSFFILSFYWFNPLLWLSYILLCKDIELACDEKVVKTYDKESCKAYSYALLNSGIKRKSIAACPLAFGETDVKGRIKNVLSYRRPTFMVVLTGIIICVITAVCFLTVQKDENELITEKSDITSTTEELPNGAADVSKNPSVWEGGGEIRLSDIEEMNIGAEMPQMLYCEKGKLIMSGTFGLIIYDLNSKTIEERIDYTLLNKLDIEYLQAYASADGERIYLGNTDFSYGSSVPLYIYYVDSKALYYYNNELKKDTLYSGLNEWDYDGSTDIPQQGYIYSYHRKHDSEGGCYLRARDNWSMKSLQVVVYKSSGETEIIDIFTGKASLTVS